MSKRTLGLRHVALYVKNLEACVKFYCERFGMKIEWQPDDDNYYLTTGHDNLALHRAQHELAERKHQSLDHIGFIIPTLEEVDVWYEDFKQHDVKMASAVKTHRDGARSFYCYDPDGNAVQVIYHPPLAGPDVAQQ